MPALFIFALFGVVFATVASLTIMLSHSSIQIAQQRIEMVHEIFRDVEFAVKEGVLAEQNDIATEAPADPTFNGKVQQYVKWSEEELITDPWGEPYQVIEASTQETIYADSAPASFTCELSPYGDDDIPDCPAGVATNTVLAPITAVLLFSTGPNRQQDASNTLPATYNDIRTFEVADGTDDIAHVFNTYSVMLEKWNEVKNYQEKLANLIAEDYRKQYELFMPEIEAVLTSGSGTFYDASGDYIGNKDLGEAWKDDPTLLAMNRELNSTCSPCTYPIMIKEGTGEDGEDVIRRLGMDEEVTSFGHSSGAPSLVNPDQFEFQPAVSGTEVLYDKTYITLIRTEVGPGVYWQINHSLEIDGSVSLSP